ncbi:MAG: hypothetical protein GY719_15030 [bacterium]|nr:hypothetical protein [bacterium]
MAGRVAPQSKNSPKSLDSPTRLPSTSRPGAFQIHAEQARAPSAREAAPDLFEGYLQLSQAMRRAGSGSDAEAHSTAPGAGPAKAPGLADDSLGTPPHRTHGPREQSESGTLQASHELWYFNDVPQGEPHPTQTELKADAQPKGLFSWSVTRGAEKVELVGGAGAGANVVQKDDNRVEVKSKLGSKGEDDVHIQATQMAPDGAVAGIWESDLGVRTPVGIKKTGSELRAPSANPEPEILTASESDPLGAPKELNHLNTQHNPHAAWGYMTGVVYTVLDDNGNVMPQGYEINEQFGAAVKDDAGTDWRQSNEGGFKPAQPHFADRIAGERSDRTPIPKNPQQPLEDHKVQHWEQKWYVGSQTPGEGTLVQTNTFQKYQDHAEHQNVKSPDHAEHQNVKSPDHAEHQDAKSPK